jgi:hypothetical protein
VTTVITDEGAPEEAVAMLRDAGVAVTLVETRTEARAAG